MSKNIGTDGVENQISGAAKEVKGKVQNAFGAVTGDTGEQMKGKAKEVEGHTQRKVGETETDIDRKF
jgi:uncharacterized protein YjbJ (UPF0337 family)